MRPGQTRLTGDYETQAKVTFTGLDIGTVLALFSSASVKAQSSIGGTVTLNGPLKTPTRLSGTAELNDFDVKLQGVELKSAGPLRVSLKNGIATLDQVHITGQDTDLQVSGTVQAFGATGPNGGKLDVKANGSVSVAIAHTFDPDILSSGKVEFTIAAGGQVKKPSLTGQGAVRQRERRDGRGSQWTERAERDAGLQRGPAAGGEPDGDDGRRPD